MAVKPKGIFETWAPPVAKVKTFVDKKQYEALESFARARGISLETRMSGPPGEAAGDIIKVHGGTQADVLAHEIGHWHHHRGRILFCGAADIGNPSHNALNPETQADQFASDLLLPDFMFRPVAAKMKRVVLSAVDRAGKSHTWMASTDHRRSPSRNGRKAESSRLRALPQRVRSRRGRPADGPGRHR